MDTKQFWTMVEEAKQNSREDGEEQVALIQVELQKMSDEDIASFNRILYNMLERAYTNDLWAAAYIINGGASDDGFEYFRCWLIAQGKAVFAEALNDPQSLVAVAVADESELESLLYVAALAYEEKTGNELPAQAYPTQPSTLTGDEWDEDTVDQKYPKLAAKFW